MARVNLAMSPTKALGKKESKIRKSLGAATTAVKDPQTQEVLIAIGVAVCMVLALDARRLIDIVLSILLFARYPPFIRHCRWYLLNVLFTASFGWKVKCATVFACFSAIAAMDWVYAIDTVKNSKGVQI
ncbi:hypothetical protein H2200_001335 [Cladophialophora chaetospira]|uniref:Uncharacterized protein n=1 Tax=Cladophialophora chaetospira TaxID=386627 RepID=A0AA38XKR8_9EURO|nr:hypothetical protein H2200_001335 [Cladophialophora chaetospira]